MAEPFLAEIRIFSFVFAPRTWALCNGQLLPINQNQGLFSLLGTTFGGDGEVNFALPDLRGRLPTHVGAGHTLGERGGAPAHTVNISELPAHTHTVVASATPPDPVGAGESPAGRLLAPSTVMGGVYSTGAPDRVFAGNAIGNTGGSQAHLNMQPFLTLSFCIALLGIFPSPD